MRHYQPQTERTEDLEGEEEMVEVKVEVEVEVEVNSLTGWWFDGFSLDSIPVVVKK